MIDAIRASDGFVPDFSPVAVEDDVIVGHARIWLAFSLPGEPGYDPGQ